MEVIALIFSTAILIALLGMVVAFSPTLVITELTVLTRSKKPIIHTVAFIAGITVAVGLFCLLAILFVDPANEISLPSTRDVIHTVPIADCLVGLLLIGASIRLFRSIDTTHDKPKRFHPERLLSTKALFWFGLLKMATSLSSVAAMLFAARYIKTTITTDSLQFAAVLWLIAISVLPFVLIAGLQYYRPASFQRIQAASDRATGLNWRRFSAITLLLLGSYFLLVGVLHLAD